MIDSEKVRSPKNGSHRFDSVDLMNVNYGSDGGHLTYIYTGGVTKVTTSTDADTTQDGGGGGSGIGLRFSIDHNTDDDSSSPRLWNPTTSCFPVNPKTAARNRSDPPVIPTSTTCDPPATAADSSIQLINNKDENRDYQHQISSSSSSTNASSRSEAIARGRKEMMEMIKDIPESFYELSLKDIVDHKYHRLQHTPPSPNHHHHHHRNNSTNNHNDDDEESVLTKKVIVLVEKSKDSNTCQKLNNSNEKQNPNQKPIVNRQWAKKNNKMLKSKSAAAAEQNGSFLFMSTTSVCFPISFRGLEIKKKMMTNSGSIKAISPNNNNLTQNRGAIELSSCTSPPSEKRRSTAARKGKEKGKQYWWKRNRRSFISSEIDNRTTTGMTSGSSRDIKSLSSSSSSSRSSTTGISRGRAIDFSPFAAPSSANTTARESRPKSDEESNRKLFHSAADKIKWKNSSPSVFVKCPARTCLHSWWM